MGDPESAGNQSREECEEGLDRMMVKMTPEERAEQLCSLIFGEHCNQNTRHSRLSPDRVRDFVALAIRWAERAAVAAETERAATVNPADVVCPAQNCDAEIHMPCEDSRGDFCPAHPARWQAAIRKRVAADEESP